MSSRRTKLGKLISAWAGVFGGNSGVKSQSKCTSSLSIDNYSQWSSNANSLGGWTSDDGSMSSISASGSSLSFTPKTDGSSYFYTTFDCVQASTDGYEAITFPIKGPAGGSFSLEIQTSTSCAATAYTSHYFQVSGLTGSSQTITVPLSSFSGASLGAVKAFSWADFSTGSYQLGATSFKCKNGSGSSSTSAVSTSTTATPTTTGTTSAPTATGTCAPLLIDDWASQSRLTFLYYNAMLQPSSDDGTMTSIAVLNNQVTLTPASGSYFYSQFDCISATSKYGGIGLKIKAAAGTTFSIDIQTNADCTTTNPVSNVQTTTELGWTFDGTEKAYYIPFTKFSGLNTGKLVAIVFQEYNNKAVTFGPMAFYCGSTGSQYVLPPATTVAAPTATVPATSATASAFVIDQFASSSSNALGYWHGGDDDTGLSYSGGKLSIKFTDSDYAFYTQLTDSCRDMTTYNNGYLHIAYTGSNKFTIALQQHNAGCDETIAPYPETWDTVYASHYSTATDIYVPIAHFNIVKSRVIGVALKGFTGADATVLSKIEIVKTIPAAVIIPAKIPTSPLVFACKRPNSLAFAIDDGSPEYAQEVMSVIKSEGIKVTFFTVGAALLDEGTNLTNVYKEMMAQGHQVALHSYTHPKMEGLPAESDIDWEITNDINAVQKTLGITSKYFRPPFGNEGSRFRERLAALIPGSQLINWSIDVQDWMWGTSDTPEKQLDAFKADLAKGGNLVVMHYLYPSTVGYLREFIQLAKATGKTLMRVDQCMEDPDAPAL